MDLEELAARVEIHEVLMRYCRGVDRGDAALIKSVYHEGAMDYHGAFEGYGSDFADALTNSMEGASLVGQHHITNYLIELDGSSAAVESYFIALHPVVDDTGAEQLAMIGGRYNDRFERRNGEWRIAERRVVVDWSRSRLGGEAWRGDKPFPKGGRRETDASASLFTNW